jgi:hypothetical protein
MNISRQLSAGAWLTALLATAGCGGSSDDGGGSGGQPPAVPANRAPTLGNVAVQNVDEDSISEPILITISDAETPPSALMMTARSSDTMLLPNDGIVIGGDGATRTLVLVPAAGRSGVTTVTVEVMDAGGARTARDFGVIVNALYRSEFSSWVRAVPLMAGGSDSPIGELPEDGTALSPEQDIPRIKFTDDSAEAPAAYDDLLPADGDVAIDD